MRLELAARALRAGLAGLCLALGAAAAEIPSHPRQLRFDAFDFRPPRASEHRLDLAGGHVAYLVSDPALPLVDVAVAVQVGSYLDPAERAGLALITGALLRRGGTDELSAEAFDERVDYLGAELDSHFGETRGGLSLSVPSWELSAGLDLLLGALHHPAFDAARLEDVRANVLEGIGRRNVEPLDVLEREWQWLLYGPESFLTRPLTATSVGAITREEIVEFHRRHVASSRLVFAISGDTTREEVEALLTARLADRPAAAPQALPPPPGHTPIPGLYLVDFDTPQAKVLLGHRATAPDDASERAAIRVMAEILGGGGAISRIAGRLRTAEGLVYRASAAYDVGEPWPRDFRIFFETATGNVGRALELALEEVERLRRELAHPRELEVVQRSIASSIRLDFDTAEKAAGWLAEDELLGRPPGAAAARYVAIGEVTRDAVRETARRRVLPQEMLILIVGRVDEILAGAGRGTSEIERRLGRRAVRLPRRDPLSLEPIGEPAELQTPAPDARR